MSNATQSQTPRIPTPLRLTGLALEAMAQRLTEWGTGITQLLSGELRLGVHAACQVVTFTVSTTAGVGTATVQTRFASRPAGVVLMQCVDANGGQQAIPDYSWSWTGSGVFVAILQDAPVTPVTLTALVVLG